jgi:hypothetical protein
MTRSVTLIGRLGRSRCWGMVLADACGPEDPMPNGRSTATHAALLMTLSSSTFVLATGCGSGGDRGVTVRSQLFTGTKINAGSAAVPPYSGDSGFSGGTTQSTTSAINTNAVINPAPMPVYQTFRKASSAGGSFTYTIGSVAPNSSHLVRLHFAETVFNASNSRRFNVSINGTAVLTNLDVFQSAGGKNKALVSEFTKAANASGAYVITFTSVTDRSMVSALEVAEHSRYPFNDYDGDGKADAALFRPSEKKWYIHPSGGGSDLGGVYGETTDVLVPGDYDGDGKTDLTVFRPSEGNWYVAASGSGQGWPPINCGTSVDRMVPGDYDGDGKTDPAYFKLSDGTWHVCPSGGVAIPVVAFGSSTDRLVPGDYDGDTKTDLAYFRPSEGKWYIRSSRDGSTTTSTVFGSSTDRLVPADYDGDGKIDRAYFTPIGGTWHVHRSSTDTDATPVQFGEAKDRVQPGDFDGDGKADYALYRPSDHTWWVALASGGSFPALGYGEPTDLQLTAGPPITPRRSFAQTALDFDGDRRSDIAFFRPADGKWYVTPSSGASWTPPVFGAVGDIAVPGDYDGDGLTDTAYFHPGDATWHVQPSTGGMPVVTQYGNNSTDMPVPADYDGDGKIDLAVFRFDATSGSGSWYAHPTAGGLDIVITNYGTSRDIPVPGDYDGDGRADVGYFSTADNQWHLCTAAVSGSGCAGVQIVQPWGDGADLLVPGDYNGDGKFDFPLFRPRDASWYVLFNPSGGGSAIPYAVATDRLAPRDYDGDGLADLAFFRPSEAKWHIKSSSDGSEIQPSINAVASDVILGGPALGWTTPALCPGPGCTTTPQCSKPSCTTSANCTNGQTCSMGSCQCATSANCPSGQSCIGGACCWYCTAQQCSDGCNTTAQVCNFLPYPGGVIYYELTTPILPGVQTSFDTAKAMWETKTGGRLSFQLNTTRADRLRIKSDAAFGGIGQCNYGYSATGAFCTWGPTIPVGNAAHELGHAIGFQHEHVRGDRDRYIQVIPNAFLCGQNIQDNWPKCGVGDSASGFGVYDMTSVMHYSSIAPYYILDRVTGAPEEVSAFVAPNQKDASNALEMYAHSMVSPPHSPPEWP